MKKITLFSIGVLMAFMTVAALTSGGVYAANNEVVPVSNGIRVLAARSDMAICGISGEEIALSPDIFERAMNTERVDFVTITKLPDPALGTLYLGSKGVSEGQTVSRENLHRLSYVATKEGISENCFTFSSGKGYELDCKVYLLNEYNYSPTAGVEGELSLNVSTHRNVSVYGDLSGYDFDGDEIRFEVVKYPECGTLTMFDSQSGEFKYTPLSDYVGKDSFEYVVRDKYGNYSSSSTVRLDVNKAMLKSVLADMGGHKAHTSAITMVEKGIMTVAEAEGRSIFSPELKVTREEFLVMVMRTAGFNYSLGAANTSATNNLTGFADDDEISAAARGYVALAKQKGFIKGTEIKGESYFCPSENITLAEAAVMVKNIINASEYVVNANGTLDVFKDHSEIPSWAESAITTLNCIGIIDVDSGYVYPNNEVTRGDAAMILEAVMRAMDNR